MMMNFFEKKRALETLNNLEVIEVNGGDDAILFSPNGIHYEGNIVRIGGKRCFQVKNSFRIGGIGSCRIMRSKEVYED